MFTFLTLPCLITRVQNKLVIGEEKNMYIYNIYIYMYIIYIHVYVSKYKYIVTQIEVSICTTGLSYLKLVSNHIYITYAHKFTCVYVHIHMSLEAAYLICILGNYACQDFQPLSQTPQTPGPSSNPSDHLSHAVSKSHHMTRYCWITYKLQ